MSIFYKAFLDMEDNKEIEAESTQLKENRWERNNRIFREMFSDNKIEALVLCNKAKGQLIAYIAYDTGQVIYNKMNVNELIYRLFEMVEPEVNILNIEYYEISAFDYRKGLERDDISAYHLNEILKRRLHIEYTRSYYETDSFNVMDYLVDAHIKNKTMAKASLRELLPDDKFSDEIDRIFSAKHPKKKYYGIPCHYKLSVSSDAVADDMVKLLVDCLYRNKRVLSRRVTKIDEIKNRIYDKETIEQIFVAAGGSTVVIVLNGDVASEEQYASQYHRVSDILAEAVKKNSGETLFIFVENTAHPGFAKQLLGKIDEELDIVEIHEGVGNCREVTKYFEAMLKKSNMEQFYEKEDISFDKAKNYSATEVRTAFNKWRKERLKDRVYSAYNNANIVLRIEKEKQSKGSAYDELKSMIGLSDVKNIIEDIIAAYKVQKMRSEFYDSKEAVSRHMIFTGCPGTAKTTVARLLTEIMKENGLLKTGAFIECGRVDLVGKYVGWTANIVKDKFRDAQGGVLFIDEAYSLVDNSNTFGAEAINTIVQEMENMRGEVIVIFAGYPDKMKTFLEQNEGLRSRIAFHVNFPNYNPEELMGILEKISKDKRYVLSKGVKDKVLKIFENVYENDEYGNGRFVRNLFEQAVAKQATRLMKMDSKDVSKERLFELAPEDFDTNIAKQYGKEKKAKIGFAV